MGTAKRITVEEVDSAGLEDLRDGWQELSRSDPAAHYFCSWSFQSIWSAVTPFQWFALVVRNEQAQLRAILPLAKEILTVRGLPAIRCLRMGGKPLADYSGLVCAPDFEAEALQGLRHFLQADKGWDRILFEEVLDPRLEQLANSLPQNEEALEPHRTLTAPELSLEGSFEELLQNSVSAKSRYDIRRSLRNVQRMPEFRHSIATQEDFTSHFEALVQVWVARWGTRTEQEIERLRHVLRQCLAAGELHLSVVWSGSSVAAAVCSFLDSVRKSALQYITAYDPGFSRFSPGRAAVSLAIQDALKRGCETYDFLLGDEDYKKSFGAESKTVQSWSLDRHRWRSRVGRRALDWRDRLRGR